MSIQNEVFKRPDAGCVSLDYSNPVHLHHVFSLFGGEEYVRENMPYFYKSAMLTAEKHAEAKNSPPAVRGEQYDMEENTVITDPIEVRFTAANNDSAQANRAMVETNMQAFVSNPLTAYAFAQGRIAYADTGELIEPFDILISRESLNENRGPKYTFGKPVEDIVRPTPTKIRASSDMIVLYSDGTQETYPTSESKFTVVDSNNSVSKMTISKPKAKDPNADEIKVGYYFAGFGKDIYYDYVGGKSNASVYLPLSGKVEFYDGDRTYVRPIKIIEKTFSCKLMYKNQGFVTYQNSIEGKCSASGTALEYDFDDDWKATVNWNAYLSDSGAKLKLNCSFAVDCELVDKSSSAVIMPLQPEVSIVSEMRSPGKEYYESLNANQVIIPQIHVFWDCYDGSTLVQMADGSQKRIDSISIGDHVALPEGGCAKVESAVNSNNQTESFTHIKTSDGKEIYLTPSHSLATPTGYQMAIELKPGDKLLLANKQNVTVESVTPNAKEGRAYNFGTSIAGSLVIVNGLAAPDMNLLSNRVKPLQDAGQANERCSDVSIIAEELRNYISKKESARADI